MNRIEGLRLIAGFLFAPGIEILAPVLFLGAHCAVGSGTDDELCLTWTKIFGLGGGYIAYSATFIVALPLFILFHSRRWLRLWQIALGGLLVGALAALLLGNIVLAIMSCVVGLITGLAFWLIAVFRNRALPPTSRSDAPTTARA